MAEGAVEAEAAEWAEAMVLILEGNVNSIDTVAATGRKCFFFCGVGQKHWYCRSTRFITYILLVFMLKS